MAIDNETRKLRWSAMMSQYKLGITVKVMCLLSPCSHFFGVRRFTGNPSGHSPLRNKKKCSIWKSQLSMFSLENKVTSNFGFHTFTSKMEELCPEVVEIVDGQLASNVGDRDNIGGDIGIFLSLATFTIRSGMTICCDAIDFYNVSYPSVRESNLEKTASCCH